LTRGEQNDKKREYLKDAAKRQFPEAPLRKRSKPDRTRSRKMALRGPKTGRLVFLDPSHIKKRPIRVKKFPKRTTLWAPWRQKSNPPLPYKRDTN